MTMRKLNKTENFIFISGAVLMLLGSAAYVLLQSWAPYVFTIGALAYVLMQFKQTYSGTSSAIHRLRGMLIISDIGFLATAFLMFENNNNFLGLDHMSYIRYIHNNWVAVLLISSFLQLYSTHRISSELEKETKKK